jgi:hypothetical protein
MDFTLYISACAFFVTSLDFPWIVRPDTSNLGPNILHFHLYSVHFYALRQTARCVLQKSVANPIQIRCIYTIDHQRCLYIFFRFEGFLRAHKKARGASATGFTQKRRTLYVYYTRHITLQ